MKMFSIRWYCFKFRNSISNFNSYRVTSSAFVNYNIDGNYITTICTDNSDNFIEFRLNINVGGTASYTCKIQEIILNTNGTVNEITKSNLILV
jgi:hypothetical protein